jgi:RecB family endonuclease NucS
MALVPNRLRQLFGPTHDQLVSAVNSVLDLPGWEVQREPVIEGVRPDIVAREPNGTTFVIEVKQGDLEANLGAVAQVEAFRNAVAEQSGGDTRGMLVVAGDAPEELDVVARSAGVQLVRTESGDVGSVRDSLMPFVQLGESASV